MSYQVRLTIYSLSEFFEFNVHGYRDRRLLDYTIEGHPRPVDVKFRSRGPTRNEKSQNRL